VLLLGCLAGVGAYDLARGAPRSAAAPSFLHEALGKPGATALVSEPTDGVVVRVESRGYSVSARHQGTVSLSSMNARGSWTRFEHGVSRRSGFGSETITVGGKRTEEFLSVARHHGLRTWGWRLRSTILVPRLTRDGSIAFNRAHARTELRIAPVRILNADGTAVTPRGAHWTLRRANGKSWWLELRLDDSRLALPYVIDPATDYPSPLYLSSATSSVSNSWRLVTTAPSGANSTTGTTPASGSTGYFQFRPGAQNSSSATPSSTPTGRGFVQDLAGGTGFASGSWSFSIETQIPSATFVPGSAVLAIGMWKGTVKNNGTFQSTQTILAPTDDPAAQNIRTAVGTATTTVTYPSIPAFSLASTERLYVEVWRKQVAGIASSTAANRQVNLVVNDAVSRIIHPPADDTTPSNAFSVVNASGGIYFTAPGAATGTVYYRGSAAGSFKLQDAATDTGSGVQQVVYPAVSKTGWTHAAETVTTGPAYQSATYSWTAGATSSPGAQAVVAQDRATNASSGSPITFTNDTTGPAGQSVALSSPTGWYTTPSIAWTSTDGTDSGSGLDVTSRVFQRDETTLTGTSCGTFPNTWTTTVTNPDTTVQNGRCYRYRLRESDRVGNQSASAASATAKVDTVAPDTTITAQPPNPSNSASPSFSFTSTESGSTFQCALDGGSFSACTSPKTFSSLADGSHNFSVKATDAAGNTDQSPASYTWTVNTTPPDTTITAQPANPTNSSSAAFSFTSTAPGSTFQCRLDAGAYAACSSPNTLSGLADGSHTFSVRATDTAGNTDPTPASFTWTVDTGPPETSITVHPSDPSNNPAPSFSFASTETGSTFECALDGAAFGGCTSPDGLSGLADGSHTFSVRATDAVGNTDPTPASFTWTVDTSPPDTTITTAPTDPSGASGSFSFTSSKAGSTAPGRRRARHRRRTTLWLMARTRSRFRRPMPRATPIRRLRATRGRSTRPRRTRRSPGSPPTRPTVARPPSRSSRRPRVRRSSASSMPARSRPVARPTRSAGSPTVRTRSPSAPPTRSATPIRRRRASPGRSTPARRTRRSPLIRAIRRTIPLPAFPSARRRPARRSNARWTVARSGPAPLPMR
jgi:hypothetical protein